VRSTRRETPGETGGSAHLDPVLDFLRYLWAIQHAMQRLSKHMEATIGVTGPQRLVLRIVGDNPGLSARGLSSVLHLHPSTITGILQRLVQHGLLVREQDPQDRRRVRLWPTAEGTSLIRGSRGTVEQAVRRALARVTEPEVRGAQAVLSALARSLGESGDAGT
jgi:MarR family transcriptional regulator, organic hydroperoxide resistance regulator